jgi:hypothetical protein
MKKGIYLFYTLCVILSGIIITSCDDSNPEKYWVEPTEIEAENETEEATDDSVEIARVYNKDSEYIVIFGDIQEYTRTKNTIHYFANSLDWIKEKQDTFKNVLCVLHVGDVTNYNSKGEWERFKQYALPFSVLIPFITVTGNHDYTRTGGTIESRSSTPISDYADFPSIESRIVARFDETIENIIVQNTIWGERYDIIALEFGPREEVVEWASNYVKNHPQTKYILLTHEWLSEDGKRISANSFARMFRNTTFSSPEQIWKNLVYPNDNIVCTICGHNDHSQLLHSRNQKGRAVPQILFNLQHFENGGNGLLELWEFPPNSDYARVKIVSTHNNALYREEGLLNFFRFKYRY